MMSVLRCRVCSVVHHHELWKSRGVVGEALKTLSSGAPPERWISTKPKASRSAPSSATATARFNPRRSAVRPRPRLPPGRQTSRAYESPLLTDNTYSSESSSPFVAPASQLFPVSAIHVAQTIDLYPVMSELLARFSIRKQMFNKNSIIVQLPPEEESVKESTDGTATDSTPANQAPRFVAVFRFGSVVAVNLSPRHVASLVADIKKKHATEPVVSGFERKENYSILQRPPVPEGDEYLDVDDAESTKAVTGDYCVVPELDLNGVSVISHIMAQTVALDTYNDIVDDLLAKFAKINADVTKTGKFAGTNREFLFKTVAQNHIIFNDMISKIRIKDRSDTAWNLTKYESIHYGMKDEFEIDDRFDHIEFKLNLIQQNAKFFVEVLQSQKSNTLEWIIVFLIAVECVIMTADMSGLGERFVSPLLQSWNLWTPAAEIVATSSSPPPTSRT